VNELAKRAPLKQKTPCWYFNQGGCSKSAEECTFEHIVDRNMRKPLHLQHPCPFYHHRTPLQCRRGNQCGGDHFYELTADEWKHHFAEIPFPGEGYFDAYKQELQRERSRPKPKKEFVADEGDFPVLEGQQPAPKAVVSAWSKPMSFKEVLEQASSPPPVKKSTPVAKRAEKRPAKLSAKPYDPNRDWADYTDSEEEEQLSEYENYSESEEEDYDSKPVRPQWGTGEWKSNKWETSEWETNSKWGAFTESHLKEQVDQLQSKVSGMLHDGKLPAVDGEMKGLVTTALKQLLEG
jgi:hypothetical protein